MKLYRFGRDGSLNTTETRGVLAVKVYIAIHLGVFLFGAAALVAFVWKDKVINPGDFWLYVLAIVLSANLALHGVAWVGGWTKQKTAESVAKADAIRAGANGGTTTTLKTPTASITTTGPANAVLQTAISGEVDGRTLSDDDPDRNKDDEGNLI